jgi:hypothetical protein
MKPALLLAILLLILGATILCCQGFTYTTHDKAMQFGPIQVTTEEKHTIPFEPLAGVVLLLGGGIILAMSLRKS